MVCFKKDHQWTRWTVFNDHQPWLEKQWSPMVRHFQDAQMEMCSIKTNHDVRKKFPWERIGIGDIFSELVTYFQENTFVVGLVTMVALVTYLYENIFPGCWNGFLNGNLSAMHREEENVIPSNRGSLQNTAQRKSHNHTLRQNNNNNAITQFLPLTNNKTKV